MFNALKSIFNAEGGEGGDASESGDPGASQEGDTGSSSVYDKDEIRRKRLAKVETVASSGTPAPTVTEAPIKVVSDGTGSNHVKDVPPLPRTSTSIESSNSGGNNLPPVPTKIDNSSTPLMPPMPPSVGSLENQPSPSPVSLTPSPVSNDSPVAHSPTAAKLPRSAVVLNSLFENILQITLKQSNAVEPIKYMGEIGSESDMISADDITSLLCNRLLESQEVNGGIGYLTGCYKRLIQKQKDYDNTNNKTDKVIAENLSRCKEEIVRFIGSGNAIPLAIHNSSVHSFPPR